MPGRYCSVDSGLRLSRRSPVVVKTRPSVGEVVPGEQAVPFDIRHGSARPGERIDGVPGLLRRASAEGLVRPHIVVEEAERGQ